MQMLTGQWKFLLGVCDMRMPHKDKWVIFPGKFLARWTKPGSFSVTFNDVRVHGVNQYRRMKWGLWKAVLFVSGSVILCCFLQGCKFFPWLRVQKLHFCLEASVNLAAFFVSFLDLAHSDSGRETCWTLLSRLDLSASSVKISQWRRSN